MSSAVSETLIRLGSEFHRRGWVLGTSGNFSVVVGRNPLRLFITASSMDKGRLRPEQFLEVDQNGLNIHGTTVRPSAETLLHIAVVLVTGAEAVLHTHSVWSTVLSNMHAPRGGVAIEGYEMLKGLMGVRTHEHREWLPILNNSQDTSELSQNISRSLRKHSGIHGLLLRGHGLYSWGASLQEAKRHIEILEFLMEVLVLSHQSMIERELD